MKTAATMFVFDPDTESVFMQFRERGAAL